VLSANVIRRAPSPQLSDRNRRSVADAVARLRLLLSRVGGPERAAPVRPMPRDVVAWFVETDAWSMMERTAWEFG